MEVELVEVACLAVAQAGVLLCIAEAELDLETGPVDVDDVGGAHGCVRGEEYLAGPFLRIIEYKPHLPFQRHGVCHKSVAHPVLERGRNLK